MTRAKMVVSQSARTLHKATEIRLVPALCPRQKVQGGTQTPAQTLQQRWGKKHLHSGDGAKQPSNAPHLPRVPLVCLAAVLVGKGRARVGNWTGDLRNQGSTTRRRREHTETPSKGGPTLSTKQLGFWPRVVGIGASENEKWNLSPEPLGQSRAARSPARELLACGNLGTQQARHGRRALKSTYVIGGPFRVKTIE